MHQGRKEWARETEGFKLMQKCWSGFAIKELLMVAVELKVDSVK
jgi:hypothetical protein